MNPIDAFNTVTGIFGLGTSLAQWYQTEVKQANQATVDNYLEWLRRQNHSQLLLALTSSAEEISKVRDVIMILANANTKNTEEILNSITTESQALQNRINLLTQKIDHNRNTQLFSFEQQKTEFKEFEDGYLARVRQEYARVQMFGVRDMRDIKQELNIAYVSLSIKCSGNKDEDTQSSKAEDFILESPLLTIRGPAGSGKSTLLSWIALQCAETQGNSNPWSGGVPFFIPLRRLEKDDNGRPNLKLLAEYSTTPNLWPIEPPSGWIHSVLKNQRGVLLIDGIDELPASDRPNFWTWLRGLLESYPNNRIYITSRFFPEPCTEGDLLWNPPKDFIDTHLQELSNSDIEILIKNWHNAVAAFMDDDPDEQARLMIAKETLPTKLEDNQNRGVLELCRTPLLCSLVCTLHWREEGYLPTKRIELYDKCCTMLIEERDKKRAIRAPDGPLRQFNIADKELILQRMAMTMMRNKTNSKTKEHNLEISRQEATDWIKLILPFCENQEIKFASPKAILDYLIERTGLLREPGKDFIDFPHRSFQEYLAACAFGAANEAGDLVNHASNDQWHETIILSAGTKTGGVPFGNLLIQKLLDNAEATGCQPHLRQQCFALAIACLETAKQISPQLKTRAYTHLAEIVPPIDFVSARNISAAGESILRHLTYKEWKSASATVVTSCVHAIRLIGTQKARALLLGKKGYCNDRRASVLCEILKSPLTKSLEIPKIATYVCDSEGYVSLPNSVQSAIRTIEPITAIENTTYIKLDGFNNLQSISKLSTLEKVTTISLVDCYSIHDIELLALFKNLKEIILSDFFIKAPDFSFFSRCAELEKVSVFNYYSQNIITYILSAKQLRSLKIVNTISSIDIKAFNSSNVENLELMSPGKIPVLEQLIKVKCFSISQANNPTLDGLIPQNCLELSISSCVNLTALPILPNLETLRLSHCIKINTLSSLKSFKKIKHLEIRYLFLQSFHDILEVESLETLTIKGCKSADAFPSINIPLNLKRIVLCLQPFDGEFYSKQFVITPIGYQSYSLERKA